jgi:hypothetical protein
MIRGWWRRWGGTVNRLASVVFAVALAAGLYVFVRGQDWTPVRALAASLGTGRVVDALAAAMLINSVGLLFGLVSWRVLFVELGSPVNAWTSSRLFFVGFLTKFLPGRFIAVPVLLRMGRDIDVGPVRLGGFFMLSWSVVGLTGLTIGSAAGPGVLGGHFVLLLLAGVPVGVLLFWPRLFNAGLRTAARLLRREPPSMAASDRGVRLALGAQSLSWFISGQHLWLLAVLAGAPPGRSYLVCVGGFAAACVGGIAVMVTPDGLGVRDAILLVALSSVLPVPIATSVVLASRIVTSLSEVAVGAGGLLTAEYMHRRVLARDPAAA